MTIFLITFIIGSVGFNFVIGYGVLLLLFLTVFDGSVVIFVPDITTFSVGFIKSFSLTFILI